MTLIDVSNEVIKVCGAASEVQCQSRQVMFVDSILRITITHLGEKMNTTYRSCPFCRTSNAELFKVVDGFSVVRCSSCQFVYVDIDEASCETANHYTGDLLEVYYAHETVHTMAYYDSLINDIESLHGRRELRILDFGCGAGMFMRRARAKGHDVVGVDFSPYAALARDRFNLNIICADLAESGLDTDSFDVIISHATYEHLLEPLSITRTLTKYLKPRGLFIVTGVPNFSSIPVRWFKNFYRNGLGHVNHFEKRSLTKLFKMCDLSVIKVRGYGIAIWWILDRLRGIRTNPNSSWPVFDGSSFHSSPLLDQYDNLDPSLSARLISKLYTSISFRPLSLSLEAWGRKPGNQDTLAVDKLA
jgi:SAM-dependent methyltransferase